MVLVPGDVFRCPGQKALKVFRSFLRGKPPDGQTDCNRDEDKAMLKRRSQTTRCSAKNPRESKRFGIRSAPLTLRNNHRRMLREQILDPHKIRRLNARL